MRKTNITVFSILAVWTALNATHARANACLWLFEGRELTQTESLSQALAAQPDPMTRISLEILLSRRAGDVTDNMLKHIVENMKSDAVILAELKRFVLRTDQAGVRWMLSGALADAIARRPEVELSRMAVDLLKQIESRSQERIKGDIQIHRELTLALASHRPAEFLELAQAYLRLERQKEGRQAASYAASNYLGEPASLSLKSLKAYSILMTARNSIVLREAVNAALSDLKAVHPHAGPPTQTSFVQAQKQQLIQAISLVGEQRFELVESEGLIWISGQSADIREVREALTR